MLPPFYRAFEDRHRGSRELIKARQQIYLPFITPLQTIYPSCKALDLGCGRGEWLEILQENGFSPQGVDLDEGMLALCEELDLPAQYGDALSVLQQHADESLSLVSGFHIAEHIPFESLQQLVAEAYRVLKPAGLLILETPNAENVAVGTERFYMDPTHEKPIPSLLLSFLTEYNGFERNKVLRLQETQHAIHTQHPSLMDVLEGPSPDYAVIAQKPDSAKQLFLFDSAFDKDYGIRLDQMAGRYQEGIQHQFAELSLHVNRLQQHYTGLEASQQQLQAQLVGMLNSRSWRLTKPLRQAADGVRYLKPKVKVALKAAFKVPLRTSMNFVLARPALRTRLNQQLQRYPKLYSRLLQFARHYGVIPSLAGNEFDHDLQQRIPILTPHGQQLYTQLSQAFEQHKKANRVRN